MQTYLPSEWANLRWVQANDTEAAWMPINRGKNKEDVAHIYDEILLSHKKEWSYAICRDMTDLEAVIQSELSQKEKNKYHILMHMCGI